MLADWVEYHRRDGFFRARNVRLGRYPIYMQARDRRRDGEGDHLHQATISYTDPGRWKPSAKADDDHLFAGQVREAWSAR